MSGPVRPPLTVTTASGTPSGRPITEIKVSNGDLTVSGNVATIDTSGSGGIPATPADAIQFNSDPAGTFTGDAGFVMSVIGGGASTVTQTGNILTGGNKIATATSDGTVNIISDGTGQIVLSSGNDQGGTWTDSIVNIMANANTDDAKLKFRDSANTDNGTITLNGSGDMVLSNSVANKDVDLHILGTGQVEIENQTTDNDTTLSVKGNGTGDAVINLNNPTKAISLICDTNQKLKVQGGVNNFILDASSATGGITWPDGTTQTTAASGASFPLEAPDGSAAAPSYSFASDTDTGFFVSAANQIKVSTGGSANHLFNTTNMQGPNGSAITPAYSFTADVDTGMGRWDTNELFFATGSSRRLSIESDGAVDFIDSIIKVGGSLGSDGQVLTSTGSGAAWEDAGGGGDYNVILLEDVINTGYVRYPISNQPPYGSTGVTAETYGSSTNFDQPYAFPFVGPESGDVSELGIEITSAAGSSCNLEVGIYSTTSTGAPDSLLGKAVFDITTTGFKYDTSLSSTVTLVKGTQYWIMFVRDTSAISYGVRAVQQAFGTPTICPTDSPNPNGSCKQIRLANSDNTLPSSSITLTDFYPIGANPPCVSLKI